MAYDNSKSIFREYSKITPGGVQSNFRFEAPHPLYFRRAQGSRLWDFDGNEYVDYIAGYGSIVLGHRDPKVLKKVSECLDYGLTSGVETELSYHVSRRLHDMIPSAEMVRFSTSGTEAVMHAIMLARAKTGARRIVKAEGAYHGWYDVVAVSHHPPVHEAGPTRNPRPVPISGGLDPCMIESTIIVPYNDISSLEEALKSNRGEVAAVILEPVCFNSGAILPVNGYLEQVRELTSKLDVPLIFDEVITGFRLAPGGAQQYFHVQPDISVFGKALGNGFPISAVVGREDILSLSAPGGRVGYGGTYNGNQISLAAADATLEALADGQIQTKLSNMTSTIIEWVREAAETERVNLRTQGIGGQFQIYFTDKEVRDYREAAGINRAMYSDLQRDLRLEGVLLHPDPLFHHGVTASHTREDLERLVQAITKHLRKTP